MAAPTSDAFRRWFRASKIAHPDGTPLVVYHGGFDVLNSRAGTFRRSVGGELGTGIYFTPSRAVADYYAGSRGGYETTGGGALTEVYLSIQNPLVVSHESGRDPAIEALVLLGEPRARAETKVERVRERTGEVGKIIENAAVKADHDGILHYVDGDLYEIVAFQPGQVKSATQNAGTYEFFDPDIRRNPMNTYNALHAAAGYALQAWMNTHRDEVERRMRAPAAVREYRYGVRNRPPGYATVPSGYIRIEDAVPDETRTRHGIVVYDRPLTDEEVQGYELHPYMPLAEVVGHLLTRYKRYGEKLADNVRKSGDRMIRGSVGSELDRLSVYTDIPLGEVYTHVAQGLLRQFPAPEPAPAAVREYRYGVRNRPPGYATVPSGLVRVEPPPFPQEARVRHGVVVYNRPLTDEEVRGYELHPYMPLAEVVDGVIASLGEYAEEAYAPNVREESAEQVRSETSGYLNDHTVYTDIPLAEVYKHVAAELLRRFPA